MPAIASGSNATITVAAGQILTVQCDTGSEFIYESPVGTRVGQYGSDRTFGPFTAAGSVKVTSVIGALSYSIEGSVSLAGDTNFDPSNVAITGGVIGGGSVTAIAMAAGRSIQSPGAFQATTMNGSGYWYVGADATAGVQFFRNASNLFVSTDRGATMSSGKGLPTGVTNGFSITKVVRAFNLWWVCAQDAGDSLYKVYSAPVVTGNGALTWTLRHTLASGTTGNIAGALNASADGNTLCVSEYSTSGSVPATAGGPSIYRCTDGTTFSRVAQATVSNSRHWHGVWEDPYTPGTWYALLGDGTAAPVWKSTDNAASFAAVASVGQGWDGVALSFSSKYIWATGDVYNSISPVAAVFVMDRATMTPQSACTNNPKTMPVINPGMYTGATTTAASATMTMTFVQPLYLTTEDIGRHIVVKKISDGSSLFNGTVSNVSSNTVTLSGTASASSGTDGAMYIVDRGERYYPLALQGCVDPATEVFYLHTDNSAAEPVGLPYRYGLFALPKLFGPLVWLDNMASNAPVVQVVGGYVMSGIHSRPTIAVAAGI